MRLARRLFPALSLTIVAFACGFATAADDSEAAAKEEIQRATRKFVDAFNAGDTKIMSSFWTDNGDFVGENGERILFREQLAARAGAKENEKEKEKDKEKNRPSLTMLVDTVRFVTPQVATVDGTSVFKPRGDGPTLHARYTATWVLRGDHWLLDSIRENHVTSGMHHAHLMALEWMVGEWTEEGKNPRIASVTRWSADGNYLEREFRSRLPGRGEKVGVQRIGWDPKREQFRSWTFGGDGSFSHSLWEAADKGWTIEVSGVTADGKSSGSLNRITKIDDNTMEWESVEATVEGESLPDLKLRLIRKPIK